MKSLQEIFDKQLKVHCNPIRIGTEIVTKRLEKHGIKPNRQQIEAIKSLFKKSTNGVLNIQIEDNQIKSAGYDSEEELAENLRGLLDGIEEELSSVANELLDNLPDLVQDSTDDISVSMLDILKKRSKTMLKEQSAIRKQFASNLRENYGEAFNLLEMQYVIALEAGDNFNNEQRENAASKNDLVFEALARLHARACQVASEILTLLKAGYADGAHARWRTLHELSVISIFIRDNGNDIAERYLLHNGIESYKASKIYQENCNALGFQPIKAEELEEIEERYQHLIQRYGTEYGTDYGWAASVIKKGRPTFYDIEKKSGLDHLRPFYKMACNNVHAGTTGILFKLGLCEESEDILLAGPSNIGLTDPGQSAAISLSQITTTFILLNPNIDRIVTSKVLLNLDREIGNVFWECEQKIINYN